MTDQENTLDHLLWIDLPDEMNVCIGEFSLDLSIPLPIEPDEKELSPESITWQRVIAATLLVLANRPSHEHAAYYRRLLNALRPELAAELTEAAEERISEEDWNVAEDVVLALCGLSPDAFEPKNLMASMYAKRWDRERRSGDPDSAETYGFAAEAAYNSLLVSSSAPSSVWFDAGVFRYRRGAFRSALETLDFFLRDAPAGPAHDKALQLVSLCREEGQADDLYVNAYAALEDGRINEGIGLAEKFRSLRPNGWPGWFLVGWSYRLSGEWSAARIALEGAEKRGCREVDLYNELAMCTRALKDYDATIKALEKALGQDPSNTKIISNMAVVLMEKGDFEESARWLQIAIALDPDDPISKKLLKDLPQGG